MHKLSVGHLIIISKLEKLRHRLLSDSAEPWFWWQSWDSNSHILITSMQFYFQCMLANSYSSWNKLCNKFPPPSFPPKPFEESYQYPCLWTFQSFGCWSSKNLLLFGGKLFGGKGMGFDLQESSMMTSIKALTVTSPHIFLASCLDIEVKLM